MNNSFDVNSVTKICNSFVNNYETKARGTGNNGFADSVKEKIAEKAAQAEEIPDAATTARDQMTMAEYKQFIYDKICQIPIHSSQAGWHWNIEITEEGFEAMKNDPSYEEYVLNAIRINFSIADPFGSFRYSILHFGATEQESYGMGWSMGNPALQESKDSFWERRAKRKEQWEEQLEEWLDKRAMARRWQQEQLDRAIGVRNAEKRHSRHNAADKETVLTTADVYEPNIAAILSDLVNKEIVS